MSKLPGPLYVQNSEAERSAKLATSLQTGVKMIKQYPMCTGGPIFRLSDLLVLWRRLKIKLERSAGNAEKVDFSDNQKDAQLPFDEYPACDSCGVTESTEVMRAIDGNRIVECKNCGLWFTSPRVNEKTWEAWEFRRANFTKNYRDYMDKLIAEEKRKAAKEQKPEAK